MSSQVFRFFEAKSLTGANHLALEDSNARIARSVLRLTKGDRIVLLDGNGTVTSAELSEVSKARVTAEIMERKEVSPAIPAITLLQGLPKGEKSSWIVQKGVEFGAKRILFFESGRTIGKKSSGQAERWNRVAVEAIRQSGNPFLPSIEGPMPLENALACLEKEGLALFLDESEKKRSLRELAGSGTPSSVRVAVGPEGGWSDDDRNRLRAAGFEPVTVGPFTLRTETAALAAMAAVRAFWP